jgi:hypothetical protein
LMGVLQDILERYQRRRPAATAKVAP